MNPLTGGVGILMLGFMALTIIFGVMILVVTIWSAYFDLSKYLKRMKV